MDFQQALEDFIKTINRGIEEHSKTFSNMPYSEDLTDKDAGFFPVGTTLGKKYIRIYKQGCGGENKSCYCFVDTTNGDILMSASWKAPAKGARGNIFDKTSYSNRPPHSIAYGGWLYK